MSAWWGHVPFAHWFVALLKPRSIVELGTHTGVSFAAFCEAVQRSALDCRCHAVDTWLGDDHAGHYGEDVLAELEPFVAQRFGAFAELMRMTFDEARSYFRDGSIDLLHIDGLHTYEAVKGDFESWLPKMSERGVVLFHDTNERARGLGVWRLWEELRDRYPSFEFLHAHGLGVLAVGPELPDVMRALHTLPPADVESFRAFFSQLGARWISEDIRARQAAQLRQREEAGGRALQGTAWLGPILRDAFLAGLDRARPSNFEPRGSEGDRGAAARKDLSVSRHATSLSNTWTRLGRTLAGAVKRVRSRLSPRQRHYAAGIERRARKRQLFSGLADLPDEAVQRVKAAFDPEYYRAQYSDLRSPGLDLFEHYMVHGWREGRNPSRTFFTNYYLARSPDLRGAPVNPFVHWVLHGIREQRRAVPPDLPPTRDTFRPKISAIVPNFNHARFLSTRIESILCQTYDNLEIIILDDGSSDESRDVIDDYCRLYPDLIRAVFNDRNSGNVFRQWRKGIEAARGDLVWICESDDSAEPTFLQNLYPSLLDESVMLAFGRILYIDADGNFVEGLDRYREGAEAGIWQRPLVRPAAEWFAKGFGVNNVVANVGGCLFRRFDLRPDVWDDAQKYQVVGDWLLYTEIASGGQIAWEPAAVSYFRSHGENTSSRAMTKPEFYKELENFMIGLKRRWSIPDATVAKFHQKFAEMYQALKVDQTYGDISDHCSLERLAKQHRTTFHILISFHGFVPGGGELFPINLANALYRRGWTVSMLALDASTPNMSMRALLHPGIAVYGSDWLDAYGLDRFLREAQISLVHSHIVLSEYRFFEQWKLTERVPYLSTLHGSYEVSDLPRALLHKFVHRVDHVVYTAERNRLVLDEADLPPARMTKLPNAMPVDEAPFPLTRTDLHIADRAVVFTLVARGIRSKGWEASIHAFDRLRQRHRDRPMHLLLCGEGEETQRLMLLHDRDPDITFLGYQQHIHGLYRISDVALVPSRFPGESFPLCIIQALQTGCPVIGTRVGEIENMLAPDERSPGGLVISPDSDDGPFTENLLGAMERFLDEDFRKRYARGAAELGGYYDIDDLSKRYEDLYRRLIEMNV